MSIVDADGNSRTLAANPVQFDETPPNMTRAQQLAEDIDEILREFGNCDEESSR